MSIESRLRAAAMQVKGITIWRTTDRRWQVGMTIDGTGWVTETDTDLPTALTRLLARYGNGLTAADTRSQMTRLLQSEEDL